MGIPFMELLALAGGVKGGRKLKAVIPGGSSAPMLTAAEVAEMPLDFDGVAAEAAPIDDVRASADYRNRVVGVLARRGLTHCLEQIGSRRNKA